MSDEIPDSADKAVRAWFAAIGFTLVIVGGEMMAEKDGSRFGLGLALIAVALPVHLTWVFWQKVKPHLSSGILHELNAIAVNPRWWFGVLLTLLWVAIFMPVIQAPRWPSLPFSRMEPATLQTTLRLQFNAVGEKPQQIDARNVHWTVANYDEQRRQTPDRKFVCDSPPSTLSLPTIPGLADQSNCAYRDIPNYHEVINTILFLTFDNAISAKRIKLNSHGAELPKWDVNTLSGNLASIYFHGDMAHMILDVEVVN